MDETFLIRKAAGGDEPAFEALVERHAAAILAVARARTCDRALAEEILQDTFVRLLRNLARFRGESALRTWLVRVALNLATDAQRRDPRRFETPLGRFDDLAAAGCLSPEESVERAGIRLEERDRLRDAVNRLPEPLRVTVTLRYDAEMSYAEIAAVLDLPIGTVASRLASALARLRSTLTTETTPAQPVPLDPRKKHG